MQNINFSDITLDDLVSEINPEPWRTWLTSHCNLVESQQGVDHYCSSNHHYIVVEEQVIQAFGYHGNNIFRQVVNNPEEYKTGLHQFIDQLNQAGFILRKGKIVRKET